MVICGGFQCCNRPELSALLQQAILLLEEKAGPSAAMPQGDWCMNGKQSLLEGTLPSLPLFLRQDAQRELGQRRGRGSASGDGDMEHSRRKRLTNSPRLRQRGL